MIDSLAYIGFTSPNAVAWQSFGPEILGLEVADTRADGTVLLRNDDAAWRIAIHSGDSDDLAYLGWSVAGADGLADAERRLAGVGIAIHADEELAEERGAAELAWFTDPFGFRHELSYGQQPSGTPFSPGRPGVGFVTGEQGLGHAVLIVPDWDAATSFFVDVMGFGVSDDIEMGIKVRFLHCNSRHHSLAFSAVPGMAGVHHLMLEVTDSTQVEAAYDLVQQRGLPVAMTLGQHTNDQMFSFYVRTPSGFEIEYGSGGRVIDPESDWQPGFYDAMSSWGHDPPATPLLPGILHPATGGSR